MSTPIISIIIPTYNSAQTLPKCLECIFNLPCTQAKQVVQGQTYKNLEVIVVNDGSTDETMEVLKEYKLGSDGSLDPSREVGSRDPTHPVKVIHQQNQGAPAARNRGFKESKGEYLLFVDADVYLKPSCIQKMYQTLQKYPEAAYAYSSFRWGWKKFKLWKFDAEKLKQMPYIHTCSLIRREAFPVSGWDKSLKRFQDWDLWLTMLESGHPGIWIPEVLFTTSTKKNTISSWIPRFIYNHLSWLDKKRVDAYNKAKGIIFKKHGL
ncbi:glycosyltransferase family 2 protein [Patescibacteria group bacterium]|nr:glycosyltransferase family 2 protein [Patescibacteria group bacterium]MBU4512914.1 glycosyltransferase family 2 protein [Patescibacteria group bacterium]